MKSNLNSVDRILRIVLAVVVVILFFTNTITGTLGIALLVAAGIILLTGLINFCPIYALLGISTAKKGA